MRNREKRYKIHKTPSEKPPRYDLRKSRRKSGQPKRKVKRFKRYSNVRIFMEKRAYYYHPFIPNWDGIIVPVRGLPLSDLYPSHDSDDPSLLDGMIDDIPDNQFIPFDKDRGYYTDDGSYLVEDDEYEDEVDPSLDDPMNVG